MLVRIMHISGIRVFLPCLNTYLNLNMQYSVFECYLTCALCYRDTNSEPSITGPLNVCVYFYNRSITRNKGGFANVLWEAPIKLIADTALCYCYSGCSPNLTWIPTCTVDLKVLNDLWSFDLIGAWLLTYILTCSWLKYQFMPLTWLHLPVSACLT